MFNAEIKPGLESILPLLPSRIACAAAAAAEGRAVEELRLRTGRPAQMIFADGERMLESAAFTKGEADELLQKLCGHSVYAHTEELRAGYVTLEGGARVGVCGRPAVEGGRIAGLLDVSGFNIRVARQVIGCANEVMRILLDGGEPVSALIASPPGGGKTTLLRDIARCLSEGLYSKPMKVAIADERGELAGCVNGVPCFDVGRRTDVMDRAPKAESIRLMIRAMSPDVIITDEIGGEADKAALFEAVRCGVTVIASAHADSMDGLRSRRCTAELLSEHVFNKVLLLKRRGSMLKVTRVEV